MFLSSFASLALYGLVPYRQARSFGAGFDYAGKDWAAQIVRAGDTCTMPLQLKISSIEEGGAGHQHGEISGTAAFELRAVVQSTLGFDWMGVSLTELSSCFDGARDFRRSSTHAGTWVV
ncbi:hypothetical protein PF005_g30333 [Phytophthora fragariae]|uniref:Uncharacterized protein n=1 Tax=Phytophthora fragariae TaxID=53985 RepID=A0A6A3EVI6_9STRA|nr:hypothetical protein PF003_g14435 [Phytophthora fragariae]KAE8935530.1 hypothetical protein PF009_g14516 [Phytophthora fragariae]KAE8962150.1 hypothetical protein PF011_g29492 [Phytophthora fragariae]KAE9061029.1 hypothetical protein PF010_g29976 [Phytophthora fragariae]KAE9062055.1 hypothetical protein PF007_g30048 [Phytophthora fragariae]